MVILKKNDCLIMPNGSTAQYSPAEKKWAIARPTLWGDLKDIFTNSPKRYIEVKVGQRVATPDDHVWYCSSLSEIVEVMCHEYS